MTTAPPIRRKSATSAKAPKAAAPERVYSAAVQQKREAMLDQILTVATRRLNRYGLSNTTMEETARDLNLLPGALYHYVKDKQELAYLCLKRGCDLRRQQLERADERGLDGLEKVRRYLRSVLQTGQSRMPVFHEVNSLAQPYRDAIREQIQANNQLLRRFLTEGQQDGSIAPSDVRLTSLAIISIVDWISFWYTKSLGYTPEQAAMAIEDIVTHGVYRRDLPPIAFPPVDLASLEVEAPPPSSAEAKRNAILRAALHAFNRRGFGGASVDMIAADLGVTRQTIYRRFRDKEELLFAALQRAQSFNDARAQLPDGCHIVDEEVLLRRALFHGHTTEAGPMRTFALFTSLSAAHREELMKNLEGVMSLDLGRIQVGLDQGFYRRIDLYIAERIRSGLFSWFPIWFDPQGPNTAIEVADNHTALFLYGLKPRPAPQRFGASTGPAPSPRRAARPRRDPTP